MPTPLAAHASPLLGLWVGVGLTCVLTACGAATPAPQAEPSTQQPMVSSSAGAGSLAPAPYEGAVPTAMGNASQDDKWWEADAPCPPGTTLAGSAPPDDTSVQCQTDKRVNKGRGTTFHGNGKKKSEGTSEKNFATGLWTEWDEAGNKVREAEFQRGSENGTVLEWYPNGRLKAERQYVDGERNGPSILWDEDGNKRLYMPYKAGKQHGTATHWTKDGRVLKLERWENDQLVQTQK